MLNRRKFIQNSLIAGGGFVLLPLGACDQVQKNATGTNAILSNEELFALFKNPPTEAKPFVRWWWNGDCIELIELERELDVMKAAGIGGVEINPIAVPEKASKIHKRMNDANISLEYLEGRLQEMVKKGLIREIKSRKNPSVVKYGRMPLAIGMFEAQVDQITKGVAEEFFAYEEEGFAAAVLGQKTKQMRTIPLNVRIAPEFHVGNYDDIRKIIDRSPGPFAVMNCVCKQAKDAIGHSCKTTDDRESCILLEGGVQFAGSLGVGKEISKKEVLALVKKAKKDGLVLQPENTQQPHFICCCCGCCCGVLTAAKFYDKPSKFLHSNYYAEVDSAKCSLCETCLERCPMDALYQSSNHMKVNNDRCIGCGACVPTCPDHALTLVQKENCYVPPASTMEMYKNIMVERFGWTGTIKIAAKAAMGMKV